MESNYMIQPEAEAEATNWLELPSEVMIMILVKLDAIDILSSAQNVCSSWRKICKDPLMWRVIDMHNLGDLNADMYLDYNLEGMCRHAVDRSCGQLVDINIENFGTDELLQHIAHSSNQLRRLRILDCYDISDEGFTEAVSKLPLLEHLEIFLCSFDVETLKTVGRCCPLLKSLKLNKPFYRRLWMGRDDEAFAIAETMPKLHHLQIYGNVLTDMGLQAILDGCPELESLDLRGCFNLYLEEGELEERCAGRIKILYLPHDPIDGCELSIITIKYPVCDSEDVDCSSGFPGIGFFHNYNYNANDYRFLGDRHIPDYDAFRRFGSSGDEDFYEY